jgi:SprT protein
MDSQIERNSAILKKYIPAAAVDLVAHWIVDLDFKLKITKERTSKLGDYRPPHSGLNHQITINYNLNTYSFFVTLIHEIAHLTTWNKYRNSVSPHGEEWKAEFRRMMLPFLNEVIFPEDVLHAVKKYLQNPAAASCSDAQLLRTLKRYDKQDENNQLIFLEKLPFNSVFRYNEDRLFVKGQKIRTRFRCKEISTGSIYLFNALAEVEAFQNKETGT